MVGGTNARSSISVGDRHVDHGGGAGGGVAVIDVSSTNAKVASVAPNFTAVAPVKPLPVMVTEVPPAAGPWVGLREVTVGASASACGAPANAMARVTAATLMARRALMWGSGQPAGAAAATRGAGAGAGWGVAVDVGS